MTSVSTDRRQGVNVGAAVKVPVKAASTANLTLSGEQTVDGIALVTGDRCLVKNQTSGVNNGIYTVDTGTWTRAPDWDGTYDVKKGTFVYVTNGTTNGGLFYGVTTSDPITIGTTSVALGAVTPSSSLTIPLAIAQGGTGQVTKATALAALGVVSLTGAGGTANSQTAAAPSSYTAFAANDLFEYTPSVTNSGAVTITVTPSGSGALAAQNVFYNGAACAGSELVASVPTLLLHDGTRLHIVGYSRKLRDSQFSAASGLINGTLTASQNGTVLTVAVKTLAGADPSPADPVGAIFRSATATTGDYAVIWLTAATSIATTVGGTFGVANSVAFRLWVAGFNDAGTFRLALINCVTTVAGAAVGRDVTTLYPLSQFGIASATQIGAGSTSAGVFYSFGAAVASKGYATLGYLTYESGLAAAGTFGVNQTRLDLFRQGVPLPGQIVQVQRNDTGAMTTGATVIPYDDTIPQITEGDQYMSQAVTPTSGANLLDITHMGMYSNSATENTTLALFQDATVNAVAAIDRTIVAAAAHDITINVLLLAGTIVATTFRARVGGVGGTITFNGVGGVRRYGGVARSYMQVEERMG